jgi:hypothetical protein
MSHHLLSIFHDKVQLQLHIQDPLLTRALPIFSHNLNDNMDSHINKEV